MQDVAYPNVRSELLELLEEDQRDVRGHARHLKQSKTEAERRRKNDALAHRCHKRAQRMLQLLDEIKEPTINNIGKDGSQAVSVLALHGHVDTMKRVLKSFQEIEAREPDNLYRQAIPSLTDRISIIERKMQKFGTNWYVADDGHFYLVPIEDYENVEARRKQYGLGPIEKPVVLATDEKRRPLGTGLAEAADQKEMTDNEHREYSRYALKREVL